MMSNLSPHVDPVWELFATQLDIEAGVIEAIHRDSENSKICLLRVLNRWKRSPPRDYPFTMESAVAILKEPILGFHQLANDIENKYNINQRDDSDKWPITYNT